MSKTYNSILMADYLLSVALSKNKILNVTKVQKLLYIAYGYFLSKKDRSIIDESPRAWPYGPVFPRTQKKVDYSNIKQLNDSSFEEIQKDEEVVSFINDLIDRYSVFTAYDLSKWSHSEGGPWDLTVKMPNFKWNNPISDELIKEYFSKITL